MLIVIEGNILGYNIRDLDIYECPTLGQALASVSQNLSK